MAHHPEVVERKQVSNGQVSYRIVCCGEKCGANCTPEAHVCEDSWHTMQVLDMNHEEQLEARKQEIAERHEAMIRWRQKVL